MTASTVGERNDERRSVGSGVAAWFCRSGMKKMKWYYFLSQCGIDTFKINYELNKFNKIETLKIRSKGHWPIIIRRRKKNDLGLRPICCVNGINTKINKVR